jgi:hypothetical protein
MDAAVFHRVSNGGGFASAYSISAFLNQGAEPLAIVVSKNYLDIRLRGFGSVQPG